MIVLELGAQRHTHLSKIIVIKHHKLTGKKLYWGIMAIIVKQATLAVGDFELQ